MSDKHIIAKRAGLALEDGDIVNLGIGIPTLVADFVPEGIKVYLHSENGILGVGPTPQPDEVDKNLVNAGKLPVTVEEGASFFDSASSFAMIRGGHVDVSILGVLQVDEKGRVANWAVPRKSVLGVGGAMDLLEGSRKVIVTTLHSTKEGESKIVKELQYPITSLRKVDLIITELAVFEVNEEGLVLIEVLPGHTIESVKAKTDARFRVALTCKDSLENERRVKQ
ncbi:3-oxoacid CoA-transferase subunit B [Neobacillus drentensis]|uniref:3-oxoacid CoA-transferase subunit B n=1 Tax=Neobacillus drentensis TaxID=220684 RepID=UPI002FFF2DE1